MKNHKRALRRHHRARLIKRAKQDYINYNWTAPNWWHEENPTPEVLHQRVVRLFNNLKDCSCPMCCNERRCGWLHGYDRLSMQEKRALDAYKDQLMDVDNLDDLM